MNHQDNQSSLQLQVRRVIHQKEQAERALEVAQADLQLFKENIKQSYFDWETKSQLVNNITRVENVHNKLSELLKKQNQRFDSLGVRELNNGISRMSLNGTISSEVPVCMDNSGMVDLEINSKKSTGATASEPINCEKNEHGNQEDESLPPPTSQSASSSKSHSSMSDSAYKAAAESTRMSFNGVDVDTEQSDIDQHQKTGFINCLICGRKMEYNLSPAMSNESDQENGK